MLWSLLLQNKLKMIQKFEFLQVSLFISVKNMFLLKTRLFDMKTVEKSIFSLILSG